MLIGFLDDTEIVIDSQDSEPDIFVFGGYFIPQDVLHDLQRRICEVKMNNGLPGWAPVKWNLKDTSLHAFYCVNNWLSPEIANGLLDNSYQLRHDLLELLSDFNAKILVSGRYDVAWREAERLKIRIKGKWTPDGGDGGSPKAIYPVCSMPEGQCICGVGGNGDEMKISAIFKGQGAVNQAFQQIVDQCQEQNITHLRRLFITVDGLGKQIANDMRALGLAIPQFGKGQFAVDQELKATFGQEGSRETFNQTFKGSWERYKRLRTVIEAFGQEADELKVGMRVGALFEDELEIAGIQFITIRDVLVTLELGKIQLEAVPVIPAEKVTPEGGGN